MLRGFRWQLALFALALPILVFALSYRLSRESLVRRQPTPTPIPAIVATETAPPAPASTAAANPAESQSPYREALVGSLRRVNPLFAHLNPVDRDIASLIFEGIFATNEYGAPTPRLAQEVFISYDDLDYVLRLRDDVLWQDGIRFSADDVIYTMGLLADPAYAKYSASSRFWQTVETQKLGDDLVRFRLAQPLGSFPLFLTIGILPEHALRGTTIDGLASHPFNLAPIGTGAYQLGDLLTDASGKIQKAILHRSPAHQQRFDESGAYPLRQLDFHLYASDGDALAAYRAGEVDVLANIGGRDDLLSLPHARVYTAIEPTLTALIFNWESPLLDDRRARRALALSLDLPALIDRYFGGGVAFADSPLIPGLAAYSPDRFWRQRDPTLAASLLEAAIQAGAEPEDAAEDTETGLSFSLLVEDGPLLMQLAQGIAAGWNELGLDVSIEAQAPEALTERLQAGDFDIAIVDQRIGGDPDVYRYWHPAQADSGENYGHAAQNEIAELLDTARRARDGIARHEGYRAFQRVFAEQAIAIPLFYPLYTLATRNRIAGIRLGFLGSGADRYRGLASWRIED